MTKWVGDIAQSSLWDPLLRHARDRNWAHPQEILLSWLLLSFPEVRWLFLKCSSEKGGNHNKNKNNNDTTNDAPTDSQNELSSLLNEFHFLFINPNSENRFKYPGYLPLFDPTGIRNRIREILCRKTDRESQKILQGLPKRKRIAAAIDEEPVYAYMNAYIAYRFGYRAWALIDWQMTERLFRKNGAGADIIFEDLYLNFPDRPLDFREEEKYHECTENNKFNQDKDQHISHLEFRDCLLPKLKEVDERILVTVGHRKWRPDKERWRKNKFYLSTLLSTRVKTLYKPFTGIFDLWKKAGKWNRFRRQPRYADGFIWPPRANGPMLGSGGHSAPGQLLVLAHRLLDRAQNILKKAETVPEAIHAALLALEAKELLINKTPTSALRALALQHEAEITAESMFYGIEYNINVKDRFREIEKEVKSISQWFHKSSRKRSELNARLTIIENLARRFRELNQFEEEQQCLAEARKLRFEFWMQQKPYRWGLWPILKYLEHALYSIPRFISILVAIVFLFGLFYYFFYNSIVASDDSTRSFGECLSAAVVFFFTLQSAPGWQSISNAHTMWNYFLAFQGMVSLFSLTLLLTHLYMQISRR